MSSNPFKPEKPKKPKPSAPNNKSTPKYEMPAMNPAGHQKAQKHNIVKIKTASYLKPKRTRKKV